MLIVVSVVAGLAVLGLVVLAGTRLVQHPDGHAGGVTNALGAFADVFDPGRARAESDLESRRHQGDVSPTPGEDDRPVRVDLRSGIVRIRPAGERLDRGHVPRA